VKLPTAMVLNTSTQYLFKSQEKQQHKKFLWWKGRKEWSLNWIKLKAKRDWWSMLEGYRVISKLPVPLLLIQRTVEDCLQKQEKLRIAVWIHPILIRFLKYQFDLDCQFLHRR
jgi:hypothetical protein